MLCSLLLTLVMVGIFAAFFRSSALQLLLAGAGALLFGFYIVFDVQMLAGGKHTSVQLSTDEYVIGAIQVSLLGCCGPADTATLLPCSRDDARRHDCIITVEPNSGLQYMLSASSGPSDSLGTEEAPSLAFDKHPCVKISIAV